LGAYFASHFGEEMGWRLGLSVAGVVAIVEALLWWGVDVGSDTDQATDRES